MNQFTKAEARAVALAEMTKWGLTDRGWKFVVDNSTARNGLCSYKTNTISVTEQRIAHDSKEQVVSTIRHEIAHVLHYFKYLDAGLADKFFTRKWTGCVWRRMVEPHGTEWKRIASKVGVAAPKAASASNAPRNARGSKWNIVLISGGQVKETEFTYARFPKRGMSGKAIRGNSGSRGRLYLVKTPDWKAYQAGRKTLGQLSFFQDSAELPARTGLTCIR